MSSTSRFLEDSPISDHQTKTNTSLPPEMTARLFCRDCGWGWRVSDSGGDFSLSQSNIYNMSTIQTDFTRLLGITASICMANLYVLKHQFQVSESLLCSPQWPGRAEAHLPAKFPSPVASVSWHQVRHDLYQRSRTS